MSLTITNCDCQSVTVNMPVTVTLPSTLTLACREWGLPGTYRVTIGAEVVHVHWKLCSVPCVVFSVQCAVCSMQC